MQKPVGLTPPFLVCYHGGVKLALRAGLGVILLAAGGAGAAIGFVPFQTHMALRRLALWRGGVHRVAVGPLLAYEKSSCRPGSPCRCVALVHGMGDSAMTWDKTMLGSDGASLPPEGTLLLAVDMPGTDGSAPAADYGIRAQSRVLRAALETRCPEWTVAGNSLGGWISGWLAVDWPQGVRRLVLVNAAGLTDPSGLTLEAAKTLSAPTIPAMKLFNTRAFGRPRPIPERAWSVAVDSIRARPVRAIFAAFKMEDVLDARLKDVKADTTILWGSSDGVLPGEFAERFHRGLRGSRVELVPGCGHLPQQECPESVSRVLFGAKL
jgi:pimeloyl-ACP methyl ester carboxylesterase